MGHESLALDCARHAFFRPSFSVHGIEAYQPDGDRTESVNDAWFRTLLKNGASAHGIELIPKILTDGVRPGPQNTREPVPTIQPMNRSRAGSRFACEVATALN
jgi:hypothetical protein